MPRFHPFFCHKFCNHSQVSAPSHRHLSKGYCDAAIGAVVIFFVDIVTALLGELREADLVYDGEATRAPRAKKSRS